MTSSSETEVEMVSERGKEEEEPLLDTIIIRRPNNNKFNIFSLSSYPNLPPPNNKERVTSLVEMEASTFSQFIMCLCGYGVDLGILGSYAWAFHLLSTVSWKSYRIYFLVSTPLTFVIFLLKTNEYSARESQSIPLLEATSVRCGIILILSLIWLRRNGQTLFGPSHARKFLVSRSVTGFISLLGFVYCIQILPMSQAIVLSFTTPILASLAARVVLNEKLKFAEILGLTCSFFGVLFIFQPMFVTQGWLAKGAEAVNPQLSHHYFAVLAGLVSSIIGGISYCLIRAGAKASDQPVSTVFSFGLLAGPASLICSFLFEDFVLPGLYSFFLIILLGIMAFFAEVLLARGLELEKTSKVANVLYIEAALSQLWGMSSLQVSPSFGRLAGCLLIFISAGFTMYIGPDKDS